MAKSGVITSRSIPAIDGFDSYTAVIPAKAGISV